jgi:hypothetical protein
VHHPAGLGLIAVRDACVPNDLVAAHRQKVNRTVERLALIEFDLQVKGLGRLARPPQPFDTRSIAGVESGASSDGPGGHEARDCHAAGTGRCRFGASPFVVMIGTTYSDAKEPSVKYMLLFIKNEENVLDEASVRAHYAAIDEWFSELGGAGKLIGGEELQASNTATTIRFQEGKPLVTDGPFMESKENVAGFVTIDVDDLDEAIAIAKKWPSKDQAVEIRPVVNHDDMPHHPVA